jgi:hypothetical protein
LFSSQCTPRSAKCMENGFSTHPDIGYALMTVRISLAQTKVASALSVDTVTYCIYLALHATGAAGSTGALVCLLPRVNTGQF